jgi:hypothetical protein
MTLFRTLSPFPPHFLIVPYTPPFLSSPTRTHYNPQTPSFPTPYPFPPHRATFSTTTALPQHKTHFPHFPHFPKTQVFHHFLFSTPSFCCLRAQVFLCWISLFLQGVGFDLIRVLQPLDFEAPTKCSTKFLNQFLACLEAKLLFGPTEPKPK